MCIPGYPFEEHHRSPILIKNANFGEYQNIMNFFVKDQPKWPIAKK
jgi:hypothetical protein